MWAYWPATTGIRLCRFASEEEPRAGGGGGAPLGLDAVLQHSDVALPLVQRHHVHQASVCTHHSGVNGRLADAGTLRHKGEEMLKHHRDKNANLSALSSAERKHICKSSQMHACVWRTRTDTCMCVTARANTTVSASSYQQSRRYSFSSPNIHDAQTHSRPTLLARCLVFSPKEACLDASALENLRVSEVAQDRQLHEGKAVTKTLEVRL